MISIPQGNTNKGLISLSFPIKFFPYPHFPSFHFPSQENSQSKVRTFTSAVQFHSALRLNASRYFFQIILELRQQIIYCYALEVQFLVIINHCCYKHMHNNVNVVVICDSCTLPAYKHMHNHVNSYLCNPSSCLSFPVQDCIFKTPPTSTSVDNNLPLPRWQICFSLSFEACSIPSLTSTETINLKCVAKRLKYCCRHTT